MSYTVTELTNDTQDGTLTVTVSTHSPQAVDGSASPDPGYGLNKGQANATQYHCVTDTHEGDIYLYWDDASGSAQAYYYRDPASPSAISAGDLPVTQGDVELTFSLAGGLILVGTTDIDDE